MATRLRRRDTEPQSRLGRFTAATGLAKVGSSSGRVGNLVRDTRSELRKVVWPTREQAINLTLIVVAVSAAVGALLGGFDFLFGRLFELIIRRS